MALIESTMLEIGTEAPEFSLVDVKTMNIVRSDDFGDKKALLVMFLCVHCPYVKHIEKDLGKLSSEYSGRPIGIVAINSNDVSIRAADGPDGMKAQAEAQGFQFPYLLDETQDVARAYKAACTPDFFLFGEDRKLAYRGEFDSSRPGNGVAVTGEKLRTAIDAVISGNPVSADQKPSIGCNIKWKT